MGHWMFVITQCLPAVIKRVHLWIQWISRSLCSVEMYFKVASMQTVLSSEKTEMLRIFQHLIFTLF